MTPEQSAAYVNAQVALFYGKLAELKAHDRAHPEYQHGEGPYIALTSIAQNEIGEAAIHKLFNSAIDVTPSNTNSPSINQVAQEEPKFSKESSGIPSGWHSSITVDNLRILADTRNEPICRPGVCIMCGVVSNVCDPEDMHMHCYMCEQYAVSSPESLIVECII